MPRRWVWSLVDIVALICLGQATMMAQREAAGPPPRLDTVLELSRAQGDASRYGTRIFESGDAVVVALRLPGQPVPPEVSVDGSRIRLLPRSGESVEDIPVPAGADPARWRLRVNGDELRIVFAKAADETGGNVR